VSSRTFEICTFFPAFQREREKTDKPHQQWLVAR
jgi:hypothetical protein